MTGLRATAVFIASLCVSGSAAAQSVAPMSQTVRSFGDQFMVQIQIQNTYPNPQTSTVQLFDSDWNTIKASYLSADEAYLGPSATKIITALVPFKETDDRVIYICNAILPRVNGVGSAYRGEVCGKVIAQRLEP